MREESFSARATLSYVSCRCLKVSDAEDKVLSLCKSDRDKKERAFAMANHDHLENKESGRVAKGSWLEYHRSSLLLIADCTLGGDPTLVVKASGLLSWREVRPDLHLHSAFGPYTGNRIEMFPSPQEAVV